MLDGCTSGHRWRHPVFGWRFFCPLSQPMDEIRLLLEVYIYIYIFFFAKGKLITMLWFICRCPIFVIDFEWTWSIMPFFFPLAKNHGRLGGSFQHGNQFSSKVRGGSWKTATWGCTTRRFGPSHGYPGFQGTTCEILLRKSARDPTDRTLLWILDTSHKSQFLLFFWLEYSDLGCGLEAQMLLPSLRCKKGTGPPVAVAHGWCYRDGSC